jgi:YhcH/YjgK/YiaL family protein
MIIDSISGLKRYYKMNEQFEKAFIFLHSNDITTLETGRYDIDGDDIYAIVSENDMISFNEAKLEVHNLYIDIQVPVSTTEIFGWKNRSLCNKGESKYDDKKDITFFEDKPDVCCAVKPLYMVLFFPHDAHAPLIGNGKIKKIVIKVRV